MKKKNYMRSTEYIKNAEEKYRKIDEVKWNHMDIKGQHLKISKRE